MMSESPSGLAVQPRFFASQATLEAQMTMSSSVMHVSGGTAKCLSQRVQSSEVWDQAYCVNGSESVSSSASELEVSLMTSNETQDQRPRAHRKVPRSQSVDGKHTKTSAAGLLAVRCIAWLDVFVAALTSTFLRASLWLRMHEPATSHGSRVR